MKKLFIFAMALAMFLPFSTQAAMFEGAEEYTLSQNETVSENLYVGGGVVILSGDMEKDVYAAGAAIIITGDVGKDLVVAGSSVEVLGAVGDDLRVAGSKVSIGKSIGGEIVAAGALIHILSDVVVEGDAMVNGAKVIIDGTLRGSLESNAEEVNINGVVEGDVLVRATKVMLGAGALIQGTLTYTSPDEVILEEGAEVLGGIEYVERDVANTDRDSSWGGMLAMFGFLKFITVLITALILVAVFKKKSAALVSETVSTFWQDTLRGLILGILAPIVSVVLLVSVLGSGFGLLLGALFTLAVMIASVYAGPVLGAWVFKVLGKKETLRVDWLSTLVGVVVITLLALVPIIGWLIVLILFLATLGATFNLFVKRFWSSR